MTTLIQGLAIVLNPSPLSDNYQHASGVLTPYRGLWGNPKLFKDPTEWFGGDRGAGSERLIPGAKQRLQPAPSVLDVTYHHWSGARPTSTTLRA